MHDAIMIMHFKKYDKLGVARATTIIFHPVDRLAGRSPDSFERQVVRNLAILTDSCSCNRVNDAEAMK